MSSLSSPDAPTSQAPPARTPRPRSGVLRATLVLSVLYLLAKFTGLLQMSVISTLLRPADSDAYQAAFTLPDALNYLVAGGALSATFIPLFTSLERDSKRDAEWFFGALLGVMGAALTVLILVCWLFAPGFTRLLNPGFSPSKLALTVQMTRIMLPAQWCFYVGGLFFALLNARKRFGVTGWTGAIYHLVAIFVGVALWLALGFLGATPNAREAFGATGFAWGILVGAFVGNFLLPFVAFLRLPPDERPTLRINFNTRNLALKRFWIASLPIMLGVSFPVIDLIIIRYFATYLGDGELNRMTVAYRTMLAPLSILAQAASVAAFPFLADESAARDYQKLADFVRSGLKRLLFVSLPLSVLLIVEAQPIINLLFGNGKFLSVPRAVENTAFVFALFCLSLFAWGGQQFVARGFYALQDTRTPTIIGSILSVFFVGLCAFAARWGVRGLAVATSLGAATYFVILTFALDGKLRRRPFRARLGVEKILGSTLRILVACAPMYLVGLGADTLLRAQLPTGKSTEFARLLIVSAISLGAFAGACQIIGVSEWTWLRKRLLKR